MSVFLVLSATVKANQFHSHENTTVMRIQDGCVICAFGQSWEEPLIERDISQFRGYLRILVAFLALALWKKPFWHASRKW
jgi:hypothetical protein